MQDREPRAIDIGDVNGRAIGRGVLRRGSEGVEKNLVIAGKVRASRNSARTGNGVSRSALQIDAPEPSCAIQNREDQLRTVCAHCKFRRGLAVRSRDVRKPLLPARVGEVNLSAGPKEAIQSYRRAEKDSLSRIVQSGGEDLERLSEQCGVKAQSQHAQVPQRTPLCRKYDASRHDSA